MATHTPWGQSQHSEKIATGIMQYCTAGHGGVHLSPKRNILVPDYLRNASGWYEEDCEWSIPATVFPREYEAHYDSKIHELAKATLISYYPDQYEKFYNVKLVAGQSSERDSQVFMEENKDNYLVKSASIVENDMVNCMATLGGEWNSETIPKRFLVSKEEYKARGQYFVIDLARHEEII